MNLEKAYVTQQETWPRIEQAEPIEDGQAVGVILREFDGSLSMVRIGIEALAD